MYGYDMTVQWFALQSKPRKEEVVTRLVQAKGIEVFYPCHRLHPSSRSVRTQKPYFPGYIFVRLDLPSVNLSTIKWMPHTIGLVSFGGEPSPVPDALMQAIQRRLAECPGSGMLPDKRMNPGDRVTIQEGLFSGYEAVFDDRVSGQDRVRVLLKLLGGRNIRLSLTLGQVRPIKRI
jgi:transcriptional antiterminator RfaH